MAKILLVDDSPLLLKIGKTLLEKEKHAVVTAKDGEEAVETAKREAPHIIFMDAEMPGMGGEAACKVLKSEKTTKGIPVYICTGHDLGEDQTARYKAAGAEGCLQKPFKSDDMLPLIAKAAK